MYIADLHIHSKYSRATSRDCDAPHLDLWARNKGIAVVGTGDFTHPAWREELRAALAPAEEGLYTLREELRLPAYADAPAPRFIITGEISSIYKKDGKTRKVHNLILLPGLDAADALAGRLERIGNIHSDGRPILGLDSRDLLEITLDACPDAVFIPAHIWTPHFSLFGAFSGFDAIEDCFGDMTPHIHALESGLSSDPPMNWRVSALDAYTLVSNSDAHSPAKLGREANWIDGEISYPALARAIQTGEGFAGTLEFFPEEGKYHLDGHRGCGVRLEPEETDRLNGKCPVCGRKITVGVLHRVCELADRPEGFLPKGAKPFESLIPLPELIAAAEGVSSASKKVGLRYEEMLRALGPEFHILRALSPAHIEQSEGPLMAEAIRRMRAGKVTRLGGFDGEYGQVQLFDPAEREALMGQTSMFGMAQRKAPGKKAAQAAARPKAPAEAPAVMREAPNPEQEAAVAATEAVVTVIAGPGTGKTKTLVARIAHLLQTGVKPSQITAVTFTNLAAAQMRERLESLLGKKAIRGMQIGTFHAICLRMLPPRPLLGESEALSLVRDILARAKEKTAPREVLRAISRVKNGATAEEAGLKPEIYQAYLSACKELGARDLDDLLLEALDLPAGGRAHLLVDEFQDINAVQRRLVRHWAAGGQSLFVIGDPDQSIYGFRGADARCFESLREELPGMRTIRLQTNYRSTPEILQAALPVISNNPGGARLLHAFRPAGAPVRLLRADTPFSEAVWIAKEIGRMAGGVDMLQAGKEEAGRGTLRAFSEMAVLCRTRRQLELVESCLRHDGVPCTVCGRADALSDDAVQGALGFFRYLLSGDTAGLFSCLRLIYGVSGEPLRVAQSLLDEPEALSVLLGSVAPQMLTDREGLLPLMQKERPKKLLERWIARHGTCEAMERLCDMAVFHPDMEDLLRVLALGEEGDLRRASGKAYASGAVRLMTLHGAKGLEFPVVFLAGVSAGSLPLEREGRPTDMEEERRLFFVGMTRAREELILSAAPPSCFIGELPNGLTPVAAPQAAPKARQLKLF